jgi:hypothetical protein
MRIFLFGSAPRKALGVANHPAAPAHAAQLAAKNPRRLIAQPGQPDANFCVLMNRPF